MIFNEKSPESQFEIDPVYLPDSKKFIASILGFKQTGERNTFGNIMKFLPGYGLPSNIAAQNLGTKNSAYGRHVRENVAGDVSAGMTTLSAEMGAMGAITGNPEMIKAGATGVMGSLPGGLDNSIDLKGDWGTKYYKKGGDIMPAKAHWWDDGPEDIAMIDKASGKKIGETSYGESINDKTSTKTMKELAAKKDYVALGKHVAREMESWKDNDSMQMKKGGTLTAAKAKKILEDGKVYGHDITEKQKKFFGFIAGGGKAHDWKAYSRGGDIAASQKPTDEEGFNWNALGGPEQLFNIGQFVTGILGTKDKLPEFHKPDQWTKFLMEQHQRATYGMTNAERAAYTQNMDRGLTTGMNTAREISGGNSAFAVGDASKFAGNYMDQALKFAVANDQLKNQAHERYGRSLLQDISFDKASFDQKYREMMLKKSNAAALAHTGLQSTLDAADYGKNYGKGSTYDHYMTSLIAMNDKLSGMDTSGWIKSLYGDVPAPAVSNAPTMGGIPATTPGNRKSWWMDDNTTTIDPLTGEPIR